MNMPVSNFYGNTGLFKNGIGGMARFYAFIDRKVDFADRAIPDFMIPAAIAYERAPILLEDFDNLAIKAFDHSSSRRDFSGGIGGHSLPINDDMALRIFRPRAASTSGTRSISFFSIRPDWRLRLSWRFHR